MFDHSVKDCRLMAIDDEEVNLALIRTMLTRAGFTNVLTLGDSSVALERIESFEPDLILLDLHMPSVDGYEILKHLRDDLDTDSFLPVIVLTADATDDATRRALALGANDFITKPYRLTELLLRVHNLLEARLLHERTLRQNRSLRGQLAAPRESVTEPGPSEVVQRLHRIIGGDGEGLVSVFQPIFDLPTGRIDGAEALPRFTCTPIRPPEEWFHDAEEAFLAGQLEIRTVKSAVAHAASLPPGVFLSVDVSPELAGSPLLASALSDAPLDRLVIEISERTEIADPVGLADVLVPLRSKGLQVAIDHGGSGHAGIQRILELRPDFLKLDASVVCNIDLDAARRALVGSLVAFGAQVGCKIMADGFERQEELEILIELGVALGQSNFLARPAPLPLSGPLMSSELRSDLPIFMEAF